MLKSIDSIVFIFLILIQIEFNYAGRTPYSKCLLRPTSVKIESLEIESCDSKKICTLRTGKEEKITIKFVADKDYVNLERVLYGVMNNGSDSNANAIELPFDKKKPGCDLITGEFKDNNCKKGGLIKGKTYTFVDIMKILPEYPKISLTGRYILRETNARGSTTPLDRKQKANWKIHPGSVLFCLRVPLVIK